MTVPKANTKHLAKQILLTGWQAMRVASNAKRAPTVNGKIQKLQPAANSVEKESTIPWKNQHRLQVVLLVQLVRE